MATDPELLRRVTDVVGDAVWVVDPDFRVLHVNAAAERLGGRPAAELVGTDLRETSPGFAGSDREAALARVLAGGPAETVRLHHPGLGRWVRATVAPDPLGALVVVGGLERTVQLERRARLEAAILASVTEGIYGVDANNRVTFVNAAAERLLGHDPDGLIGTNSHVALHHTRADGSPYPERQCPLTRTLVDGQARDVEDLLWRADGTPIPVEYHVAAIRDDDGDIAGAVVTFRDLSDRFAAAEAEAAAASATGALYELQQVLQPPPPVTDDPLLGVYYLPADLAGAGGDLYDWQSLPDDGLHLTVVDVVGKGLLAARDALAVTHALRLLILARTPLDHVVRQASWLLADAYPDLAATGIVAHYEQRSGRLQFVSAGHPPPLLVHPDGSTEYLEASGRPLGWPDAGTDDIVDRTVPPGGRVVFYTDGLVEAGRDILAGMRTLAQLAARSRHRSAADAARALVTDVLTTAERRDDCLALVLDRPRG